MKTCPNCRTIHQDHYNGTCQDCGAPLGSVQPNGGGPAGGDRQFRFARQIQRSSQENAAFSPEAMRARRGSVEGQNIEQSIVDIARAAVEHFGFIGGQNAA